MSEAKRCDRCGKYYTPNLTDFSYEDEWWRYSLYKDCHPYPEEKIDLCSDCRQKLYEWLKEGELDE